MKPVAHVWCAVSIGIPIGISKKAPTSAPYPTRQDPSMAESKERCRLCNGETTVGKLQSGNQDARIVIAGKPDGFLGVIPWTTSGVKARVCRDCGHIDLFARDLTELLPGA